MKTIDINNFENEHKQYLKYLKENTNQENSSIFWDHFRKNFGVSYADGKVDVTGQYGKGYDPRNGQYSKEIKFLDGVKLFLSRKLIRLANLIKSRTSKSATYLNAYNVCEYDKGLPENLRLFNHPIFRIGDNCALHPHLIRMFMYFSILYRYTNHFNKDSRVLEIGSGSGMLSVLFCHSFNLKYTIVDLPEMIAFSSAMIKNFLPESKILLPHNVNKDCSMDDYDVVFLLPSQVSQIKDDSIDLSVNIHSFMEMKNEEIHFYFEQIQRVTRNKGLFFTENRYEKIPGFGDKEERLFFNYPWNLSNKDEIFEISKFHKIIRHHLMLTRLQRVNK